MKLQSNANGDIINNGQQTVTGDDINGSTNPELLGGRTVSTANRGGNSLRQQGENSRKISSFVENGASGQENNNSTLRAGDSGWFVRQADQKGEVRNRFEESVRGKISRIAPSGFDTIGRKISNEIKERFKNTVFKDENGNLLSLYHWTQATFEAFAKGEFGFHFGTLDAARDRYTQSLEEDLNTSKGTYKEVYLNIKNPYYIPFDAGVWCADAVAHQLKTDGIITNEQQEYFRSLEGFYDNTYDNPAAQAVREFLSENGYDGIIYENDSEDEGGISVIAFYPDQILTVAGNGVLKENNGVSEADLDNGPASFMPENDSNDDSREPGFREPDTKEIYRKSTEKDFSILTGKRKNAAQRQMEAVAEKFGVKVGYKDDITKGYYDPALKTIYMNPVWSLTEQYFVLFKHELTHHLENYKAYDSFKYYVVNFSNSFDAYVRDRLKDELGEEFKGGRKEALKAYNDIVLKQRQASKEIPDRIKKSYNPESIEREIVADFVGEVMLGGKDAAKAEAALMEIAKTEHRTVLEKIRDWVKEWVSIIKGEPQNRTLAEDLEYLNRRIARVLDSKEIKKSTTQSGVVKFDIAVLENGNTYVKASRNIIKGKTLSEQRNDITNFFKKLLKNKPSIDIHTIEGDILTLTMDETADKARDNYEVVKGQRIKTSEDEFAVKLRVESHIDEIVETSIKSNKPLSRDAKRHDFAKDGFEYRTAYFEDFDGKYYKIRFSIGHNGTVATVYNVGKIKEDVPSSAKLIAVVGSQALDGTSSNDIILNEEDSVKNNISREGEKYSSENANSKHSVASEAFSKKLAE